MTIRQICDIKNNQVVINLPENFKNKTKVLVIVDDKIDIFTEKLMKMKEASKDPLFMADIKEIGNDFNSIDAETL